MEKIIDILVLIKKLNKCIIKDFNKKLEDHNLTSQQGRVVFYLSKRNAENRITRQKDIENDFELSKSTVSGLIKRLISKGFIKREKEKGQINLLTTELGQSIVKNIFESRSSTIDKIMKNIEKNDQTLIEKYLEKMIDNMEEEKC